MLLCKVMLDLAEEVGGIINSKMALKYGTGKFQRDIDAMRAIATAHTHRSLEEFKAALAEYGPELTDDVIIKSHINAIFDRMLQSNLERIIEPFSRVEIEHVAHLIKLPRADVETKLSQMILDKKLNGILDQGAGCLEIFDASADDPTYTAAIETIEHMGAAVQALYAKAQKLL